MRGNMTAEKTAYAGYGDWSCPIVIHGSTPATYRSDIHTLHGKFGTLCQRPIVSMVGQQEARVPKRSGSFSCCKLRIVAGGLALLGNGQLLDQISKTTGCLRGMVSAAQFRQQDCGNC